MSDTTNTQKLRTILDLPLFAHQKLGEVAKTHGFSRPAYVKHILFTAIPELREINATPAQTTASP